MKRYNNLFEKIVSMDNIRLAHRLAQRGKRHYTAVKKINKDPEPYLLAIHKMLITGTFTTSNYRTELRFDSGKWRTIHKLPYYPDRIVQYAIMNVCAPIWRKSFIRDTFQSIEARGTHDAKRRVEKYLKANPHSHAIKIDIKQFYPSILNSTLKVAVKSTIKCFKTLRLLYDIIDSHSGLPIGNYTSQYLGNLLLTSFDWWIKQTIKLKGYFRYCDDIVLIHTDSKYLHNVYLLAKAKLLELGLVLKDKVCYRYIPYQGIDFCGFIFFGSHTKIRSKIIKNLFKKSKQANPKKLLDSLMAYYGWIKIVHAKVLWSKIITYTILRSTDSVYSKNPLRKTL